MTEEEIRRRHKERKRQQKLKRRRIIMARRAVAAVVALLVVVLVVKGILAVTGLLFGKDDNSGALARNASKNTQTEEKTYDDKYLEWAAQIDVTTIEVEDGDELGQELFDNLKEYPQYKIILANRSAYPDDIVKLGLRNKEALGFVLDYPNEAGKEHDIEVDDPTTDKIPLYIQWDEMWGYEEYGNNIIAISGCGPTSLSMVATYLFQDKTYTPSYMANFSQENGYCTSVGTDWLFMSEGAQKLGLTSTMVNLDEVDVARELQDGKPIICSMGPGDFTDAGHFIVLTGYEDGYVTVNDPNSPENSAKKWLFADIINQIKNIWAFSLL